MPIQIVRNDITKMAVDAIVNAANPSLLGGGGVDGAIHRAAGRKLLAECRTLGGCEIGDAKITGAYELPCKYVIHTVGPVYRDGKSGERELLESCYRRSLELAGEKKCATVAFPLISSGVYGYPKDDALRVAIDTCVEFLSELDSDMLVYIVIFDRKSFFAGSKMFDDIKQFIDDNYADAHAEPRRFGLFRRKKALDECSFERAVTPDSARSECDSAPEEPQIFSAPCINLAPELAPLACAKPSPTLDDALKMIDESFSEMLLRKIDESGMKDSECYKKANIDRKLFSKIRSDKHYKPGKPTAIAFAVALSLNLDETRELLMKAGFALSKSNKFDIIVEYFISRGNYSIHEINEALFAFDQRLLGA